RWPERTPSSTSSTERTDGSRKETGARVRLGSDVSRRLAGVADVARRGKIRVFLVGGAVRDLLAGLPVRDLDLAVEGDAVELARRVARALAGTVRLHGRFGTATVETPEGERIDVAATRRETYARPGALPRVSPAPIEEDLLRRDFTVHAMAIPITTAHAGRL